MKEETLVTATSAKNRTKARSERGAKLRRIIVGIEGARRGTLNDKKSG